MDLLTTKNLNMTSKNIVADAFNSSTTTMSPFTSEEEDAIVTLVVVVVGIIVAIIILFSLAIFMDCRQQKRDLLTRKQIRLKISQRRKNKNDDHKSFAKDMCPNSVTNFGSTRISDEIV
ncbi:hypothetical protein HCN44_000230 [Aphidius gifuensis]|uniref:Uncharacterized protein n=1 Tax=Aphidius gifuensis TaxID=684658 RepID=A0A835CRP1_APHGI|nr:uncharacterized protein LOC122855191 [Aphidius gifuensis]KAF7990425.1 hypothetical protein HCN44_000230 [Aphidius gifuensis]